MDGNRTSNFAIPISSGEWAQCGPEEGEEETKARKEAGDSGIFYQVLIYSTRLMVELT
jgi:hypothetical protein